ncbi:SUMO-activating enzyme subunit 1A [Orobanche gracilis]
MEAISVPWKSLPRRVSKLYLAKREFNLRTVDAIFDEEIYSNSRVWTSNSLISPFSKVIEKFEERENRIPGDTYAADLQNVQKLRKELSEANSVDEFQIPDSLLERLLEGRREFPPVCAVVGGILGQEVIKALSGKGDPLKNFFFYDAMDGKGIIEDISEQKF